MSVRSNAIQPVLYNTTVATGIADGITAVLITKVFGAGVYLITGTLGMTGATLSDVQFVVPTSVNIFKQTTFAATQTAVSVPISILWTSDGLAAFSITARGTGAAWTSAVSQLQVTRLYSKE